MLYFVEYAVENLRRTETIVALKFWGSILLRL